MELDYNSEESALKESRKREFIQTQKIISNCYN
jgi:hypothetical protein